MSEHIRMSTFQENIYAITQVYKETAIANIGGLAVYHKPLNRELTEKAYNMLVEYNPALRLKVSRDAKVYEAPYVPFRIDEYDFSELTEKEFEDQIQKWFEEPFDLFDSNLFDFKFIHRAENDNVFSKFHHIIVDGTSVLMMILKSNKIYKKLEAGEAPEREADERFILQLKDSSYFTDEERVLARAYFSSLYSGCRPDWLMKPVSLSPKAERKVYRLSDDLLNKTGYFSKEYGIGFSEIFYAALYRYISVICSSKAVVVGRILLNRTRHELTMIGMKANTLPLLMDCKSDQHFSEVCKIIKQSFKDVGRFAGYGYSELI